MTNSNKIQEYIDTLENDKLMIETHFANIERILKDNDDLKPGKSNCFIIQLQYIQYTI